MLIKYFDELNPVEVYQMLKLRSEIFIVEQECVYLDIDGKDIDGYHLLEYDENENIVGCLRILSKGATFDTVSIGRVCVKENFRGKDIGTKMMHKAIDFIDEVLNEKSIKISAQTYLVNFYKDLGFEKISDPYLEDGIKHVDMYYEKKY
ncbi:MAG: GNAT family N-acetyltransferase [Bacillota bacterium]